MLSVVIIGMVWQPGQESVYESAGLGASVGWNAGGAVSTSVPRAAAPVKAAWVRVNRTRDGRRNI